MTAPSLAESRDNVGVSAAAANIAAHELADFLRGFCPTLRDQPCRRANLPRRAVAALERIMVDERLLQRMQRALGRETLNCGDLRTVVHDGKRQARIDAPPVNEHGTGAALALIAAFFRPGQVQMLAQQVKERCAGIEHEVMMRPIDAQAHRDCLRRRQTGGRHPHTPIECVVLRNKTSAGDLNASCESLGSCGPAQPRPQPRLRHRWRRAAWPDRAGATLAAPEWSRELFRSPVEWL